MKTEELQKEAYNRAITSQATTNYPEIFAQFAARGLDDIRPRENVFTYRAWQALGRQVRKGEKGVQVTTWIKTDNRLIPKRTTVFHISQTEPV